MTRPLPTVLLAAALLAAAPASATAARTDLRVTRVSAVAQGASITIDARITGRATRSTTAFALREEGSRAAVLTLRRSATIKRFTFRHTLTPGRWTITACADATRRVRERSERNNCRTSTAFTVAPTPP